MIEEKVIRDYCKRQGIKLVPGQDKPTICIDDVFIELNEENLRMFFDFDESTVISKEDMKLSRFISMILRHKPGVIGAALDDYGYIDVSALIKGLNRNGYSVTMADIERIVAQDDKQRYSFNGDKTKIKANQGHSLKVNLELKPVEPPKVLYHGTSTKYSDKIALEGIVKRSRQYVHLSSDIETAEKVGSRHGKVVVFNVDSQKMYEEGYKFYLSENKVWLTDHVPAEFLKKIES